MECAIQVQTQASNVIGIIIQKFIFGQKSFRKSW